MDIKHNANLTTNARTLRKNMTKEERHLWYDFLKWYHIRFLRQKVIDNYIVDFYCHSARLKGKTELEKGNTEAAIELFRKGQVLPQSLGAGIWNHCKLIPLKYHEALCLELLGKKTEADEIFSYIANVTIEYFSNMHLKELPYWQAKAFMHLGEPTKAQHRSLFHSLMNRRCFVGHSIYI